MRLQSTALLAAGLVMMSPLSSALPATGEELQTLQRRHAAHLESLARRQDPISDIIEITAFIFLEIAAENGISDAIGDIATALASAFNPSGAKAPWENPDNCKIAVHTHGGEDCFAQTTPAASSGNSSSPANTHDNDWNVCPWPNPSASNPPPAQFWTDPGIGAYSVQFTATDTYAWSGPGAPKNTRTCVAQGLCNPQLVFYRNGYNLVIDTWNAHDDSYGGYSGQYAGLCQLGDDEVEDQFGRGGDVLGDTCAIPCWNQAELPSGDST